MHQNLFNKVCFYLAIMAVMIFSLAGYHHHEDIHICLGWEHLMHHNHCHRGLPCLPAHNNGTESLCHCHLDRMLAIETNQELSVKKQQTKDYKSKNCVYIEHLIIFQDLTKKYPEWKSPHYSSRPYLYIHGLRAPPCIS